MSFYKLYDFLNRILDNLYHTISVSTCKVFLVETQVQIDTGKN